MKRYSFRVLAATLLLAACLAPPALAGAKYTGASLAARTTAGNGGSFPAENWRRYQVTVRVTAGSGTVTTFRVWMEGSPDEGNNWYPIACMNVVKGGAAAPGSVPATAQRDIVNETAVQTSATYLAICETLFDSKLRVQWDIQGTTPSETFEVLLYAK